MEIGSVKGGKQLVETVEKLKIPCWLCGKMVEIKWSIKGKPYIVCDVREGGCGMQVFLREHKAIELLNDKIREGMKHG